MKSALADDGWGTVQARVATFFVQAGLWSTPHSQSNDYYSRPQRGDEIAPSNYQVDLAGSLSAPRFEPVRGELAEVVAVSAVQAGDFRFALPPPVFDALYGLYRVADWVLSAGFFVGLLVLARTRQTLLLGVGLIVVVNWLGAAWLISQVDRFAVPFLPIKWVIGTVGVAAVTGWLWRARRRPTPAGAESMS